MKILGSILLASSIVGSCATKSYKEKINQIESNVQLVEQSYLPFAESITINDLKMHLNTLASADFEGRATGTKGQKRAAMYIKNYYIQQKIAPAAETYYQTIPSEYIGSNYRDTENVLAYIPGDEKPDEFLIISGHYDHEGISEKGEIYFGADDNASGTSALLEIAQAFKLASDKGFKPKRSIIIMHATAEEIGLYGSRFYVEHPIFPLKQTVVNLNIDMIGRVDTRHEKSGDSNYIYVIGADRLSHELHFISEAVNRSYTKLNLDYKFNDTEDHNRYYYRSDHYNFAKENIPVIFYFNGEHEDYHKPTDTVEKINFPLLQKRTQLIFATAWQIANQEQRIQLDEDH